MGREIIVFPSGDRRCLWACFSGCRAKDAGWCRDLREYCLWGSLLERSGGSLRIMFTGVVSQFVMSRRDVLWASSCGVRNVQKTHKRRRVEGKERKKKKCNIYKQRLCFEGELFGRRDWFRWSGLVARKSVGCSVVQRFVPFVNKRSFSKLEEVWPLGFLCHLHRQST